MEKGKYSRGGQSSEHRFTLSARCLASRAPRRETVEYFVLLTNRHGEIVRLRRGRRRRIWRRVYELGRHGDVHVARRIRDGYDYKTDC